MMRGPNGHLFLVVGVLIGLMTLASGCADTQNAVDEPTVLTTDATAEEEVRTVLGQLRDAVRRADVNDTIADFSEQYSSNEATGLEAVREWWTRVIDTGFATRSI
jgi:hypothetical protein